jgi:hypothetical protein
MHARIVRTALLVVLLLAVVVGTSPAAALAKPATTVTLKDRATGLTVRAPRGYTLRQANGYYTVRGGGMFGTFMTTTSPLPLKATAAALVKQSGGTLVGRATSTAKLYRATIRAKAKAYVLIVRPRAGGKLDVSLVGTAAPVRRPARAARLVTLTPAQLRQVNALDAIIRTRRGGNLEALVNVPIPMRLATTADNLASANVPNLPGWVVDGGNGLFAVTHPQLGWGWFGMTVAALTPAFPYGRPGIDTIITPSADPAANMQQALPQYLVQTLRMQFQFTQAPVVVPGSEGILGPTIPSAMYQARFTWNGIPMQGLFLWGTLNQTDVLVNSYFSGIAIADAAPGSYSNALLQTWASANGEAGFRERLSTTLDRLAERPDREFILTPSRFRQDASTWISLLASGAR